MSLLKGMFTRARSNVGTDNCNLGKGHFLLAAVSMERKHILSSLVFGAVGFFTYPPILVAAVLVLFTGNGVRGRWLFLVAGPLLAYSILWVFTLVVIILTTYA